MPGSRGLRRIAAVLMAFGMAVAVAVWPGTPAYAAVTDCSKWGATQLQGGQYKYIQNEWNSNDPQCASIDPGSGAWSITQANFNLPSNGAPATYPASYKGCHWGDCTSGSGLPIQVSQLGSATSSVNTTQVGSGAYNASYDIWFNSTPTTSGQPDGTELMIWLNSRGGVQPFGSQTGTANVAGYNWEVWTGQQAAWKIISYRLQGGGTSFNNLNVKALITDGVNRGSINSAHYLLDAEFGFEIWQGGQGLGVNSYSFTASTSGGGGDTTAPTAPSNLTVTGTTSSTVSLSWNASSDNVGVTAYDIYSGSSVVKTVTGSPPATTATVTGLAASTSYTFTVKARDAAGNTSTSSNAVTATTQPAPSDTTPPTAPSGLTVTGTTSSTVSLSWNASSDNVGVTAYDIYSGSSVVKTVTGSPPATTATVTGLAASTSYTFTVKARDAAGNTSTSSNAVTATTTGSGGGGSWTISLQAISPNPTNVGTATNVTVDFKNTASTMASNVTLVITVVDSTGAVVGSQSWTGQNIASQQTLNETYTWNPRSSGAFTVKAKVTDAGGGTLASNDNIGTVTVR